jgi:hypothetical protein
MDKLQAKHDALEKEHEELKKVDNAEAIAEGVKARVALLEAVKPMLSEEDAKKADSMTDEELRIAAIRAAAAFAESEKTKREDGKSVIGDGSGHVDAEDLDAARQKMQGRRDGTAKEEDKK